MKEGPSGSAIRSLIPSHRKLWLSARSAVHNYHFDTFMTLNGMGRLLVILDGFDEMKHTMTWEEFRFNFQELNRLVVATSRVILLGRPSAFLSDAEHTWVLRGVRQIGANSFRMSDWPEYRELHLAPFSEQDAFKFIHDYLTYRPKRPGTPSHNSPASLVAVRMRPPGPSRHMRPTRSRTSSITQVQRGISPFGMKVQKSEPISQRPANCKKLMASRRSRGRAFSHVGRYHPLLNSQLRQLLRRQFQPCGFLQHKAQSRILL
jgi:hypothetical protein